MLEVFLTMECWCFLIRINRIRRGDACIVFSPTGFNVIFICFHLVLNQDLQDFEDYKGRLRFGCKVHSYIGYFIPSFSPMRYASSFPRQVSM